MAGTAAIVPELALTVIVVLIALPMAPVGATEIATLVASTRRAIGTVATAVIFLEFVI